MHNARLLLLTLCSWLVACGGTPESYVEGRFFGTRNGGPVDISFRFTNGGMGGLLYGDFLREDHRGTEPTFINLDSSDREVKVRAWSGPEAIEEDAFEFFFRELPSPPIHAGTYRGAVLGVKLNDSFIQGSVISRGRITSNFTYEPDLHLEGRFQLPARLQHLALTSVVSAAASIPAASSGCNVKLSASRSPGLVTGNPTCSGPCETSSPGELKGTLLLQFPLDSLSSSTRRKRAASCRIPAARHPAAQTSTWRGPSRRSRRRASDLASLYCQ